MYSEVTNICMHSHKTAVLCRSGSIIHKQAVSKLQAPMLRKKAVLQQLADAAAAGIDADLQQQSSQRKHRSFAELAAHDSMADL